MIFLFCQTAAVQTRGSQCNKPCQLTQGGYCKHKEKTSALPHQQMTQHWTTSYPEKWKLQWKTLRTSFRAHVRTPHGTWQHSEGLFSRRSCPLPAVCCRPAISVMVLGDVSASITTGTVYSFAGRLIPPSAPVTQQTQLKGQPMLQHECCTQISLTCTPLLALHRQYHHCHQQATGLIPLQTHTA